MRTPMMAGLFAVLLCVQPVFSAEPDAEMAVMLEDCVADAAGADDRAAAARACIGKAASACMGTPEGQTTMGMVDCASRESAWWDKLLNQRWSQLKEQLEPDSFADLRDAQRKWIAFRDADCQWVYDHQFGNGSLRIPVNALCVMDATAVRALKLGELVLEQ